VGTGISRYSTTQGGNMFITRWVPIIAVLATLVGCATTVPLQRGQIDAIRSDSAPATVEQALGRATPTAQFEFAANGNVFFVRQYLLQIGSRQELTLLCTPICTPVFYSVPVTRAVPGGSAPPLSGDACLGNGGRVEQRCQSGSELHHANTQGAIRSCACGEEKMIMRKACAGIFFGLDFRMRGPTDFLRPAFCA